MLQALRITNLAVIEEVEVGFGAGLTVLTGETGAGKSILIDALGLLLGGRADPDIVRAGCDEAVVEGVFQNGPPLAARLAELGLPDLGAEVGVRRVVAREGRTKAYVNGALVTVGVLSRLMKGWVDIAGQHEHIGLFDPQSHRELLDRQGKLEDKLAEYRDCYRALLDVDRRIEELGGDEKQGRERLEFLKFQLEELERLAPVAGRGRRPRDREAAAALEREAAARGERVRVAALGAGRLGARAAREGRGRSCSRPAGSTRALGPAAQAVQTARVEVEDVGRSLSRYLAGLDGDPQRLAEVDERLDALKRLCRKHATTLDGVISRRAELAAEVARLSNRDESLAAAALRAGAEGEARARAGDHPRGGAAEGGGRVRAHGAGRARAARAREGRASRSGSAARTKLSIDGLDEVEFFFSANPGEPLRPLAKVASGGEASRLLLALKGALAGLRRRPLLRVRRGRQRGGRGGRRRGRADDQGRQPRTGRCSASPTCRRSPRTPTPTCCIEKVQRRGAPGRACVSLELGRGAHPGAGAHALGGRGDPGGARRGRGAASAPRTGRRGASPAPGARREGAKERLMRRRLARSSGLT